MKKNIPDYIKHVKKLNREEEIKLHGKPISYHKVVKSKKLYSRKNKPKSEQVD